MRYSFRAECGIDVAKFVALLPREEIIFLGILPDTNGFPDADITIELVTITLDQIIHLMAQVPD